MRVATVCEIEDVYKIVQELSWFNKAQVEINYRANDARIQVDIPTPTQMSDMSVCVRRFETIGEGHGVVFQMVKSGSIEFTNT